MSFDGLDLVAVSRSLSQLVEKEEDLADAYFERREVLEVPGGDEGAGVLRRREEGFAVRLARADRTWMATGDGLDSEGFLGALRQVARSWPQAAYPAPALGTSTWSEDLPPRELLRFPSALNRALRRRLVAFPLTQLVRRHHRELQVVGTQVVPDPERESFFSIEIGTSWGRRGFLATSLGEDCVNRVADELCGAFEARDAEPPEAGEYPLVLAPQAAAILLHEAVAHALEADILASGGRIEAAIGLRMGGEGLSVLDDPSAAPEPVRRSTDDEGRSVVRRWLLRDGIVEQPLADFGWAQRSGALIPGAGRRGGRVDPPGPRSSHLVLLTGESAGDELLAGDDALWVPAVTRGSLDPATGLCRIRAPYGLRVRDGELTDPVGPFVVEGHLADLLSGIEAIGSEPQECGAGWCAKGRQRMAVWATTPAIRIAKAGVSP